MKKRKFKGNASKVKGKPTKQRKIGNFFRVNKIQY
jgi:hypothetical protein